MSFDCYTLCSMLVLLTRSNWNYLFRFKVLRLCNSDARTIITSKSTLFAGHSKWANIKHIKAAKDGEKAALFRKLSRQIRLALQEGGNADPALNTQLKSVIEEAVRKNMPMATINNNIQKYKQNKNQLKKYRMDVRYKQKVFLVCVIYTDNFPSVKMDIAPILRKSGATTIDANNIFQEIGLIEALVDKSKLSKNCDVADKVVEDAILFGAEDIEIVDIENGLVNFICRPFEIMSLRRTIESNGYIVDNTEHIYTPTINVELIQEELMEFQKFITKIKNVPGVEEIYDNIKEQS